MANKNVIKAGSSIARRSFSCFASALVCCATATALLVPVCVHNAAAAHHGDLTTRVESGHRPDQPLTRTRRPEHARINISLRAGLRYFGSQSDPVATLGTATITTFVPRLSLTLPTMTTLAVQTAAGITTTHGRSTESALAGWGDTGVYASQEFVSLFDSELAEFVHVQGTAGVMFPTGSADDGGTLSVRRIGATSSGTSNAQTSLGIGAHSFFASASVSSSLSPDWQLRVGGSVNTPLNDTQSGIRWGNDWQSNVELAWRGSVNWGLGVGVDYSAHSADAVPTALEGSPGGTREQLSVHARVDMLFVDSLRCGMGTNIPVWQQGEGAQLLRSVTVFTECGFSMGD